MIVLLTDFGQSECVGVMKGVIYSIACDARIVDLCHSVSPQDIIEGSWVLKNNCRYFPKGATFCCVVDPGVGTGCTLSNGAGGAKSDLRRRKREQKRMEMSNPQ